MEAGVKESQGVRRQGLWLLLAVVFLMRLPFLNQAIEGDDDTYISEAEHALIDPLHPAHTTYVFRGVDVDLRGHSHPPLDAWVLAGLLAVFGDVKEVPFHAAYILFSLLAAAAMWSLARRFSPRPLWAALLFLAVPAFVVNGNSFESDLPFLAFWISAMALFCAQRPARDPALPSPSDAPPRRAALCAESEESAGRVWLAVVAMALASMAAYQAVFLTPILAVYVWLYHRADRRRWAAIFTPPLVTAAWQIFERLSTGALPAGMLAGYFAAYNFQALAIKARNAAALTMHACWILFPGLLAAALWLMWGSPSGLRPPCRGPEPGGSRARRLKARPTSETRFLLAWIAIFFAGAIAVFFAGSARYLLPIAAPVALLASRLPAKWLAGAFAAQMTLSLGLATVNYEHWDACRRFAAQLRQPTAGHRVWVDGELGLRFYLEAGHALPLRKTQKLRAGDIVVSSELTQAVAPTAPVSTIARMVIQPAIPLRLIGLESQSGYSDASRGLWPFGMSAGVIDRLRADLVMERHPTREYLPMNAPEAAEQIVSGIYQLEAGAYRWMSASAAVIVKSPQGAAPLAVTFTIPAAAPARRVILLMDGRQVAAERYPGTGTYELKTAPLQPSGATADVEIQVDRTFSPPPDTRELGIVLSAVGFVR